MQLERYEFLDPIATGGMAEVFRARASGPHGFQKIVAIKRVRPSLAGDPAFERWFIDEAKLAVTLSHANVVQVLDFGRVGASLFLVMEFVDGLDLAQLIARCRAAGRKVPLVAAAHIAVELAKGLAFAHERGVIHRDLSPSNVLVSRAGEVKLGDFGVALAAERDVEARSIAGKWPYMSPEQTRGEVLDARSDLFSAGAVMWELFTGELLFDAADAADAAAQVRAQPIVAPSTLRPELPRDFDTAVLRTLERTPAARFASAGELLRALVEATHAAHLVTTPAEVATLVAELDDPAATRASGLDAQLGAALARKLPQLPGGTMRAATETSPATIVRGARDLAGVSVFEPEALARTVAQTSWWRGRMLPLAVTATLLAAVAAVATARLRHRSSAVAAPPSIATAPQPVAVAPPPAAVAPAASRAAHEEPRYGRIDIYVQPWARVYFHDEKIADAPVRGLRLPLGHHRLRLVNPVQHRSRVVEVDVPAPRPYRFTLP